MLFPELKTFYWCRSRKHRLLWVRDLPPYGRSIWKSNARIETEVPSYNVSFDELCGKAIDLVGKSEIRGGNVRRDTRTVKNDCDSRVIALLTSSTQGIEKILTYPSAFHPRNSIERNFQPAPCIFKRNLPLRSEDISIMGCCCSTQAEVVDQPVTNYQLQAECLWEWNYWWTHSFISVFSLKKGWSMAARHSGDSCSHLPVSFTLL